MLNILIILIILTILVSVHELGHLITAKKCGVYCSEYSIGMGPVLWQYKGTDDKEEQQKGFHKIMKETTFSIRCLPIGGYVAMAGETEDDEVVFDKVSEDQYLDRKTTLQQTCVMIAGVVMNFILGFCLITAYIFTLPVVPGKESVPICDVISEDSPAELAGFEVGDQIIKLEAEDGSVCYPENTTDVVEFIQYNHDDLKCTVLRDNTEVLLDVTPEKNDTGTYYIGYATSQTYEEAGFLQRIGLGFKYTWEAGSAVWNALGMLVQGKGFDQLSSPVGMTKQVDAVRSVNLAGLIYLAGVLSINLGIFNLLPIPALDGGRIVILWLEKLFRVPKKVLNYAVSISMYLILGLSMFLIFRDLIAM